MFPTEIKASQRDTSKLDPGQASLHDGRIMHGSEPNTSAVRRCGYTMRYISNRTKFDSARHPHHQIYLACGRDHVGNPYADPTKSYPELIEDRIKHGKGGH